MTSVKLINHSSSTADWNYYDAVEAAMATVSLSSQSTVEGSVRAIAQFEIK